ncbi:hypothetical protein E2C01_072054 [Portunus trituberculatus]|uniref:Uncharacterized protein n=1 Tax=Portunus trituberculatus TaxID=210409 RepID=A0A5B7I7X5_PORTR|nr:hypothetical protein [Portunus trituberculatus]
MTLRNVKYRFLVYPGGWLVSLSPSTQLLSVPALGAPAATGEAVGRRPSISVQHRSNPPSSFSRRYVGSSVKFPQVPAQAGGGVVAPAAVLRCGSKARGSWPGLATPGQAGPLHSQ